MQGKGEINYRMYFAQRKLHLVGGLIPPVFLPGVQQCSQT